MPAPMTKTFDAVEMSRRLRVETGRKLASLTREQRMALLNAHIRPAREEHDSSMALREDPPKP